KRGGSLDWSSPADEGWRRAAQALRTAETAAAQQTARQPAEPATSETPGARTGSSGQPGRPGPAPWGSGTTGGERTPGQPAGQPERVAGLHAGSRHAAASVQAGLPVRQRGATLVPG